MDLLLDLDRREILTRSRRMIRVISSSHILDSFAYSPVVWLLLQAAAAPVGDCVAPVRRAQSRPYLERDSLSERLETLDLLFGAAYWERPVKDPWTLQ